jgi:hypothetical protein
MTAYADVVGMCENKGGNIAIGRGEVAVSASVFKDLSLNKNGKITFAENQVVVKITAEDLNAVSPHPKELGCPNNGFTITGIYDATFTGVNLSGYASNGKRLFSHDYTCYYSGKTLKGCW